MINSGRFGKEVISNFEATYTFDILCAETKKRDVIEIITESPILSIA